MSDSEAAGRERNPYIGWWASAIFLAVTFVAAGVVWFMFHPW